jgi:hypothetical protein
MAFRAQTTARGLGWRLGALALAFGLVFGLSAAGASATSVKSQAKRALLVLSDMPKGWKKTAASGNGSNNFPGAKELAGCIGVNSALIESNPPEVDSPDFHSANQSYEVDDAVSIFPTVANAKAEFAAVANAKTPTCLASLMNGPFKSQISSAGGAGTTVGTISVAAASTPKNTAAFSVNLPITDQGVTIQAKLTIVYFIKGRLGQQITYYGFGPAFPASLQQRLTTTAIHRL